MAYYMFYSLLGRGSEKLWTEYETLVWMQQLHVCSALPPVFALVITLVFQYNYNTLVIDTLNYAPSPLK